MSFPIGKRRESDEFMRLKETSELWGYKEIGILNAEMWFEEVYLGDYEF